MKKELLKKAIHPELSVAIERPLKKGWKKKFKSRSHFTNQGELSPIKKTKKPTIKSALKNKKFGANNWT